MVEAADEADLDRIAASDPVVKAGLGTVETYPMPMAHVRSTVR
ncbi:hypothetical protein ACFOX0_24520 [Micromonospora zhanjiangensis]|uniref:YCII-related domain-containing protein n=1 Tax=Micromonospora zhanjiangensis TaxID=1522057 RepID=A0ABV8KT01_9ACTN